MGLSATMLGSAAAAAVLLDGANGFLAFPSGRGEVPRALNNGSSSTALLQK